MDYDKRAMASMGVDPQKWAWLKKDYSQYPVNTNSTLAPLIQSAPATTQTVLVPEQVLYVDPRPARALKPALLTFSLLFLVLLVGVFAAIPYLMYAVSTGKPTLPVSASMITVSTLCGAAGVAMALIGALCFNTRLWVRIIGFIFSSIPVFSLGGALTNMDWTSAVIISLGLVGAIVFGFTFSKSLPYRKRVKAPKTVYRTVTQEIAATYFPARYYPAPGGVYGTPGGVAGAVGTFDQGAIDAGVKGEENTAALLDLLLKIPGTTVFHGLKFPGSKTADVDHAVHHGDTVYLLDSKMYRAGAYEWDHYAEVIVSPGNALKDNHMGVVADGYRQKFGYYTKVIPMVVIHGRNIQIGEKRWSVRGVGLFTPEEAMAFMGDRMSDSMPLWRDDPSIRGSLVDNLKI